MDKPTIKMGCDPELEMFSLRNGSAVNAGNHLTGYNSEFGLDGSDYVVELRPTASLDCMTLVKNISSALRKGFKKHGDLWRRHGLRAGSGMHYDTGGHIHFGCKNINYETFCDEVLHNFFIPIFALTVDRDNASRRDKGYGRRNSDPVRSNSHGFEYRNPPSWLITPVMTYVVLQSAQCLIEEYNRGRYQLLSYTRSIATEMTAVGRLRKIVNGNLNALEQMNSFKWMHPALWKAFRDKIQTDDRWNEGKDIFVTWGIREACEKEQAKFRAEMERIIKETKLEMGR